MEELSNKLNDWVGIKYEVCSLTIAGHCWVYPNGEHANESPDFPNDLNACFKWLVPKLKNTIITIQTGLLGGTAVILHQPPKRTFTSSNSNPALALCLAIEELLNG